MDQQTQGDLEPPYQFAPHNAHLPQRRGAGTNTSAVHKLVVRQQPLKARAGTGAGAADRNDRRPIDPPPIVELMLVDSQRGIPLRNHLHNPYYILHTTLYHAERPESVSTPQRCITGNVVSSMWRLKDLEDKEGAFFVFPNLIVRAPEGLYRISFNLFEICEGVVYFRAQTLSQPFKVFNGKSFPGMAESTPLSRCFAEQGVRLRVRNESPFRRFANPKVDGAIEEGRAHKEHYSHYAFRGISPTIPNPQYDPERAGPFMNHYVAAASSLSRFPDDRIDKERYRWVDPAGLERGAAYNASTGRIPVDSLISQPPVPPAHYPHHPDDAAYRTSAYHPEPTYSVHSTSHPHPYTPTGYDYRPPMRWSAPGPAAAPGYHPYPRHVPTEVGGKPYPSPPQDGMYYGRWRW